MLFWIVNQMNQNSTSDSLAQVRQKSNCKSESWYSSLLQNSCNHKDIVILCAQCSHHEGFSDLLFLQCLGLVQLLVLETLSRITGSLLELLSKLDVAVFGFTDQCLFVHQGFVICLWTFKHAFKWACVWGDGVIVKLQMLSEGAAPSACRSVYKWI